MNTETKIRLGALVILVVIAVFVVLGYFNSITEETISTGVKTGNKEVVDAVKEVGKKVDVTNAKLETGNGYLSTIKTNVDEYIQPDLRDLKDAANVLAIPQRAEMKKQRELEAAAKQLEKAKKDSAKAADDLKKAQENSAKLNKSTTVVTPPTSADQNANLVGQIGQMIDTKLAAKFDPLSKQLDSLKSGQAALGTRMTDFETRMKTIESDVNRITNPRDKMKRMLMGEKRYIEMKKKELEEKEDCDDLSGNK